LMKHAAMLRLHPLTSYFIIVYDVVPITAATRWYESTRSATRVAPAGTWRRPDGRAPICDSERKRVTTAARTERFLPIWARWG
jgi:hypothetical protein